MLRDFEPQPRCQMCWNFLQHCSCADREILVDPEHGPITRRQFNHLMQCENHFPVIREDAVHGLTEVEESEESEEETTLVRVILTMPQDRFNHYVAEGTAFSEVMSDMEGFSFG